MTTILILTSVLTVALAFTVGQRPDPPPIAADTTDIPGPTTSPGDTP